MSLQEGETKEGNGEKIAVKLFIFFISEMSASIRLVQPLWSEILHHRREVKFELVHLALHSRLRFRELRVEKERWWY